jgi:hypothetical protein
MGKDVEFEEDMESKSTSTLQRVLVKWIQEKTPIGLMANNGSHPIAKAVYHGEAWLEIYETWYNGTQNTTNHLLKNPTSILEIPRDSILYQVTRVSASQYTTQNENVGQRKSFKTLRVTAMHRTNKASWWVSAHGKIIYSQLWRHSLMERNVCVGTGTITTAWAKRRCTPRPGPSYGAFTRTSAKGIQLATFSLGKYAKQMKQRGNQWAKTKR